MLIIYVKHFLNEEGINYFDCWFKECLAYLSAQDGFYSLYRAFDGTEIVHVWLHFESKDKMLIWGNSNEHEHLILKLDPYRTRPWEASWYDTDKPGVEKYVIALGQHTTSAINQSTE